MGSSPNGLDLNGPTVKLPGGALAYFSNTSDFADSGWKIYAAEIDRTRLRGNGLTKENRLVFEVSKCMTKALRICYTSSTQRHFLHRSSGLRYSMFIRKMGSEMFSSNRGLVVTLFPFLDNFLRKTRNGYS